MGASRLAGEHALANSFFRNYDILINYSFEPTHDSVDIKLSTMTHSSDAFFPSKRLLANVTSNVQSKRSGEQKFPANAVKNR